MKPYDKCRSRPLQSLLTVQKMNTALRPKLLSTGSPLSPSSASTKFALTEPPS